MNRKKQEGNEKNCKKRKRIKKKSLARAGSSKPRGLSLWVINWKEEVKNDSKDFASNSIMVNEVIN